jgi:hypothetical protein
MNYKLNKDDIINMIYGINANNFSIGECIKFEKVNLMYFSGNQHNEKWDWNIDTLNMMSESELYQFYNNIVKN